MIERLRGAMISFSGIQIKEKKLGGTHACAPLPDRPRVDRNFIGRPIAWIGILLSDSYSEEQDMHGEEQRHAWNQDMRGGATPP
jgi:hypothetical protein